MGGATGIPIMVILGGLWALMSSPEHFYTKLNIFADAHTWHFCSLNVTTCHTTVCQHHFNIAFSFQARLLTCGRQKKTRRHQRNGTLHFSVRGACPVCVWSVMCTSWDVNWGLPVDMNQKLRVAQMVTRQRVLMSTFDEVDGWLENFIRDSFLFACGGLVCNVI